MGRVGGRWRGLGLSALHLHVDRVIVDALRVSTLTVASPLLPFPGLIPCSQASQFSHDVGGQEVRGVLVHTHAFSTCARIPAPVGLWC